MKKHKDEQTHKELFRRENGAERQIAVCSGFGLLVESTFLFFVGVT
jgi:hypothetical protein